MQSLEWFHSHIGKKVYRNHSCPCRDCVIVEKEWLVIMDENHAEYLYTIKWDYLSEWIILNYRETLEIPEK
jgi:hypothetical protein